MTKLLRFLVSPLLNERGSISTIGKNTLADGIGQTANLQLVATVGASEIVTGVVTFSAASSGVIDIASSVTLTIPSGNTISNVYLRVVGETLANHLANETLTINNDFPSGGDLIVTSFQITVT